MSLQEAVLLSKNEADCLAPQHRQGATFDIHRSLNGGLPRERFRPLAGTACSPSSPIAVVGQPRDHAEGQVSGTAANWCSRPSAVGRSVTKLCRLEVKPVAARRDGCAAYVAVPALDGQVCRRTARSRHCCRQVTCRKFAYQLCGSDGFVEVVPSLDWQHRTRRAPLRRNGDHERPDPTQLRAEHFVATHAQQPAGECAHAHAQRRTHAGARSHLRDGRCARRRADRRGQGVLRRRRPQGSRFGHQRAQATCPHTRGGRANASMRSANAPSR